MLFTKKKTDSITGFKVVCSKCKQLIPSNQAQTIYNYEWVTMNAWGEKERGGVPRHACKKCSK